MIITEKTEKIIKQHKIIYLLDFANVVYILMDYFYNDRNKVIEILCMFLLKMYQTNCVIFIISKTAMDISLLDIINYEEKNHTLFNNFLQSGRLIIYDLYYKNPISSSVDDLLFNLIMVDIYSLFPLKQLVLLTNDKQKMNKNLFGRSKGEDYHLLQIRTIVEHNPRFIYAKHISSKKIKQLLEIIAVPSIKMTYRLPKCITSLVSLYKKIPTRTIDYRKVSLLYNRNKSLKKICRNQNSTHKRVDFKIITQNRLQYTYYLYAYIKYIQQIVNKGNLYGSMSLQEIVKTIIE